MQHIRYRQWKAMGSPRQGNVYRDMRNSAIAEQISNMPWDPVRKMNKIF